jgi:hypothetical protein
VHDHASSVHVHCRSSKLQERVAKVQALSFSGGLAGQSICEKHSYALSVQAHVVSALPKPPWMISPSASYRHVRCDALRHEVASAGGAAGHGVSQVQPFIVEQLQFRPS